MTYPLSILCVTKGEPHVAPFLEQMTAVAAVCGAQVVFAGDGPVATEKARQALREFSVPATIIEVQSRGFLESVLQEAVSACEGDYILRLDDDERCSPAMVQWLEEEDYRAADHWKFCTANLWGNELTLIVNPPLWPDHHTRLSVKAKAGGRHTPHAGSPFGGGELAPVIHEHHKFLVKGVAKRKALARHYERMGALLLPFTLPEAAFDTVTLAPLGMGLVREWAASELRTVPMPKEPWP